MAEEQGVAAQLPLDGPNSDVADVEFQLLHVRETFIYRVPPRKSSGGHRAEDWGLDKPMITGELKVIQKGDDCRVRLYDPGKTGPDGGPVLFAECPIVIDEAFKKKKLEFYVESVVDSSRYFVLRVEDAKSGRHAYLGVGFRERESSFDFKSALQNHIRYIQRQQKAEEDHIKWEEEAKQEGDTPSVPGKDYSLKEGQTFSISIKGGKKKDKKPSTGGGGLLLAPPGGLLAPPPGGLLPPPGGGLLPPPNASGVQLAQQMAGLKVEAASAAAAAPVEAPAADEDEDWGDFS